MKKITLILIIFFTAISSFAQEWAPVGATWYYTRYIEGIPPNEFSGYTKIESIGEEEILDVICKVLEVTNENGELIGTYYTYENEENQVFKYVELIDDDIFCMIYDFGLNQGGSYNMICHTDEDPGEFKNYILASGFQSLNGISLYAQTHLLSQENTLFDWYGTTYESIGNTISFLPWELNTTLTELICYQDDYLGEVIFNNSLCDVVSGIEDVDELSSLIEVFPNPVTDVLMLNSSLNISSITITNMQGLEVMRFGAFQNELNLSELSSGVYHVTFVTANGTANKKIVVSGL